MSPRLAILTGTLAGQTRAIGPTRFSLGRDSLCDIRFDPAADTEVSGRHAELRIENDAVYVRDANSTNGVYVNGSRVRGEQRLADGDIIRLGATGPKIRFDADATSPGKGSTNDRIAVAVGRQTRGLRAALLGCFVLAIGAGWFALWSARHDDEVRGGELEALRRRNDSLSVAINHDMRGMTGRIAGIDSAQRAGGGSKPAPTSGTGMNFRAIVAANGRSVVMIAVEMPDGKAYSGSGVSVSADGKILTNAHLVRGPDGQVPTRIAVVYADTPDWLPARVDRVAGDADLAVLRVDRPGPFPFVGRLAQRAPLVGEAVALLGFPLAATAQAGGSTQRIVARSTLTVGTVSKVIPGVVQIDAFASEGSSGSPVFREDGSIIGLVYGGAPETAGRIVYAVPASAIKALLK